MAHRPSASQSPLQASWQGFDFTVDRKHMGHVSGWLRINGRDHRIMLSSDAEGFQALRDLPLGKLYPFLHGLARYPTYNNLLPSQDGRKKPRGRSAAGLQAWQTARWIGPQLRSWAQQASQSRDATYAAAVKRMKHARLPSPLAVAAFLVELNYQNADLKWPGPSPLKDPKNFFRQLDRRHKKEPPSDVLYSAGFDRSQMAKSILGGKKFLVVAPAPVSIGF